MLWLLSFLSVFLFPRLSFSFCLFSDLHIFSCRRTLSNFIFPTGNLPCVLPVFLRNSESKLIVLIAFLVYRTEYDDGGGEDNGDVDGSDDNDNGDGG